jgi:hypothetical protein
MIGDISIDLTLSGAMKPSSTDTTTSGNATAGSANSGGTPSSADSNSGAGSTSTTAAGDLAPPPLFNPWLPVNVSTLSGLTLSSVSSNDPVIGMPPTQCSPEDMFNFIARLVGQTQDGQLQVTRESLKTNEKKLDDLNAKAKKQIDDWIKKTVAAQKAAHKSGALKWVMRILMPLATVGAAALTVVTAGATAGVLAVTAAMTAYTLAGDVSSQAGGPDLSLADNLSKGFTQMLEKCGMSKADAEKHADLMTGVLGSLVEPGALLVDPKFAGKLAGGVAKEAGASARVAGLVDTSFTMAAQLAVAVGTMRMGSAGAATAKLSATAAKAVTVGQVTEGAVDATNGAVSITDGANDMKAADAQRNADLARADQKRTNAFIVRQQSQMDQNIDDLKKVAAAINDTFQAASDDMKNATTSQMQMMANLASSNV